MTTRLELSLLWSGRELHLITYQSSDRLRTCNVKTMKKAFQNHPNYGQISKMSVDADRFDGLGCRRHWHH